MIVTFALYTSVSLSVCLSVCLLEDIWESRRETMRVCVYIRIFLIDTCCAIWLYFCICAFVHFCITFRNLATLVEARHSNTTRIVAFRYRSTLNKKQSLFPSQNSEPLSWFVVGISFACLLTAMLFEIAFIVRGPSVSSDFRDSEFLLDMLSLRMV